MTAPAVSPIDHLKSALGDTYAIDRELGRGGMATVYLAQDVKHDRLVALKVLHREVAESLAIDPDDSLTEYNAACAYALLRDSEKSMDHLAGAMAKGWQNKEWIVNDPDFAFMRDLPRYRELIGKMRSVLVPPTS